MPQSRGENVKNVWIHRYVDERGWRGMARATRAARDDQRVTTEDAMTTTNGRDRTRARDGDNFYARDDRTNARHSSSLDASRPRARDNPECPYPSDGWIGDVTRRVRAACASDVPVRMREY